MDEAVLVEKSQENPKVSSGVLKEKTSSENSEYDSVDSYTDEDERPEIKVRSRASGLDSHSESEAEGSVILEREEGDGQESLPSKKVDDDEDKKNPQYIPKRGTFYEHDDRTAEDVENQEEADPEKAEKDGKKKVWQDKKERWTHDRFNDQEQTPKSRTELVAIYGYDIRNEDGPPRARRRRRYGRGPNKYTRNWEDEDAYAKPPPTRPQRGVKKQTLPNEENAEEFPPLGGGGGNNRSRTKSRSSDSNLEDSHDHKENEENVIVQNRRSFERQDPRKERPAEQHPHQQFRSNNNNSIKPHPENVQDSQAEQYMNRSSQSPRVGTGRVPKPKKEIKDSDFMGFTTKTRQQRGVRTEHQKVLPPRNFKKENDFIQSQNFTSKNNNLNQVAEMEKEISQMSLQDGQYNRNSTPNTNNNQTRQGSVPPRLQNNEQKGSKRYSSMRQRSLPETGTPPGPPPNFSFYPTDYNSVAPPPATQQPMLPPTMPPPNALVPPPIVPVTAAPPPLLQAPFPPPAAFAAPPPPQAFLQAAPPPFIAAPPAQPQIVSFVTQAQPAYVQGYQGQFNTVAQPPELYQPQGGITYYSADQQIIQRAVPQKRPKAAIPIVAPTDFKENKEHKEVNQNLRDEINSLSEAPQDVQE